MEGESYQRTLNTSNASHNPLITGAAEGLLANVVGQSYGWILGNAANGAEALRQSMFNNLWRDAGTGVALGFYDELRVERISEGLEFELSGEGSEAVPRDETHLVIQAMRSTFEKVGLHDFPALRLTAHNRIPHSRGMGSSASAIVAGVAAAKYILIVDNFLE